MLHFIKEYGYLFFLLFILVVVVSILHTPNPHPENKYVTTPNPNVIGNPNYAYTPTGKLSWNQFASIVTSAVDSCKLCTLFTTWVSGNSTITSSTTTTNTSTGNTTLLS